LVTTDLANIPSALWGDTAPALSATAFQPPRTPPRLALGRITAYPSKWPPGLVSLRLFICCTGSGRIVGWWEVTCRRGYRPTLSPNGWNGIRFEFLSSGGRDHQGNVAIQAHTHQRSR